jgi:Zn-dependent protease
MSLMRGIIEERPEGPQRTVLYSRKMDSFQSPLTILFSNPVYAVLLVLSFIVAIVAHEGNHALVATALGDDTPRRAGRISLNPMRHLDPMGLLMYALAGIGWASTPVNPYKLRPNPRLGNAIVAAAGPLANLALALVLGLLLRYGLIPRDSGPVLELMRALIFINMLLFVFNLIPLPPLDGYTVLMGLLPSEMAAQLRRYEQYGPGLLLVLVLVLPFMFRINPVGDLFGYVMTVYAGLIRG